MANNLVKKTREELHISKAELARKAGLSPLTIDRVEKSMDCRMETKRKVTYHHQRWWLEEGP